MTIQKSKKSLNPGDVKTVESFKSWDDVQKHILDGISPVIALIQPALSHLVPLRQLLRNRARTKSRRIISLGDSRMPFTGSSSWKLFMGSWDADIK